MKPTGRKDELEQGVMKTTCQGRLLIMQQLFYFELFYHTLDEENHFNAIQLKIGLNIMEQ